MYCKLLEMMNRIYLMDVQGVTPEAYNIIYFKFIRIKQDLILFQLQEDFENDSIQTDI